MGAASAAGSLDKWRHCCMAAGRAAELYPSRRARHSRRQTARRWLPAWRPRWRPGRAGRGRRRRWRRGPWPQSPCRCTRPSRPPSPSSSLQEKGRWDEGGAGGEAAAGSRMGQQGSRRRRASLAPARRRHSPAAARSALRRTSTRSSQSERFKLRFNKRRTLGGADHPPLQRAVLLLGHLATLVPPPVLGIVQQFRVGGGPHLNKGESVEQVQEAT